MIFYHGTTEERLRSIIAHGLKKGTWITPDWATTKRFEYWNGDVNDPIEDSNDPMMPLLWKKLPKSCIVVASHPCGELVDKIICGAIAIGVPWAVLLCCLPAKKPPLANQLKRYCGAYKAYTIALAQAWGADFRFDGRCLSSCNGIVTDIPR